MLSRQLITQTAQALAVLPPAEVLTPLVGKEAHIVEISRSAADNPRIQEMTANGLTALALLILQQVQVRSGLRSKDQTDSGPVTEQIAQDLLKFRGLTKKEILQALTMGLDGDFNPDGRVFFSSTQFVQWVKAYINQAKAPVMKKHAQLLHQLPVASPEPTIEERVRIMQELIEGHVAQMAATPGFQVWGASGLYTELEALGIYTAPADLKRGLYSRAKEIYPDYSEAQLKDVCKSAAYNEYIAQLVETRNQKTAAA
jgi:hypothetical protein